MHVTIMRHGQARRPADAKLDDDARILSAHGRDAVRATAAALLDRGLRPSHIYCSPLVRAIQTAELAAAGFGFGDEIDLWGCLEPYGSAGEIIARLGEHGVDDDILLVSHEPICSQLSSALAGVVINGVGTADAVRLSLTRPDVGGGTLLFRWLSSAERFIE